MALRNYLSSAIHRRLPLAQPTATSALSCSASFAEANHRGRASQAGYEGHERLIYLLITPCCFAQGASELEQLLSPSRSCDAPSSIAALALTSSSSSRLDSFGSRSSYLEPLPAYTTHAPALSRRHLSPLSPLSAKMSLLVDKWRPKTLDDLAYHSDLSERLRALVSSRLRLCYSSSRTRLVLTLSRRLKLISLTRSSTDLRARARSLASCAR